MTIAGLLGVIGAQEKAAEPDPYQVDFIEETGIDLILLDVEVYDEDGRPLRGLSKENFILKINGKIRTLYSVDDLCSCSDPAPDEAIGADDLAAIQESLPTPQTDGGPPAPVEPMLYILYLNFGQLDQDGRFNALAEARRWIRDVMQSGEQAQIMAWTSLTGLRRLTGVTGDRDELLAALDEAEGNPELNDPFPVQRYSRQRECEECYGRCGGLDTDSKRGCVKSCQVKCRSLAREEYSHGSWSMKALQQLLYRMEQVRGSKTILYFFQNDALYPARLYAGLSDSEVRDLNREMEQVGADAVLSRTTIAAAYSGSASNGAAINVGANLADYSGGSYNRSINLLPEVTGQAGRGCRCIYRLGVEPPPTRRNDLYHAAVFVNDRRVPRGFRLQHLSRFDRWLREAQAVLLSPEDTTNVPLTASLQPLGLQKGRWRMAVRVAVDARALLLLPAAGGRAGAWETGALMYRDTGSDPAELLAHSRLTVEDEAAAGRYVVHERILEGLKPGERYLGAFVRDRNARAFGGGQADMILPRPGEAGLSRPVPLRTGQPWIRTGLPDLTSKRKKVAGESRSRETLTTALPLPGQPVHRGDALALRTWVCAPKKGRGDAVVRYVSLAGKPIFRFDSVTPPRAGTCAEVTDPLDTRFLEPGEYTYHIKYSLGDAAGALEEERVFVLE
jgi:hypothetical protein